MIIICKKIRSLAINREEKFILHEQLSLHLSVGYLKIKS